jgi:hypothetical protein
MKKLKFKLFKDKIFAHNSRLLNNTEPLERVIDFTARTDYEWSLTMHKFFENGIVLWFKWISWIFATSLLGYIEYKTENSIIRVLKALSEILLFLYFLFYFISFNFIFSKNPKSLVSYILNWTLKIVLILVVGYFGNLIISKIIELVIATKF